MRTPEKQLNVSSTTLNSRRKTMNKHERQLIERLFWYLQHNKNEHRVIYNAKEILASIIRGEYSIATNLLDAFTKPLVSPPLPCTPTPICPHCGSQRIRIVYKDDEGVEVDFYDCTWCSHVWTPDDTSMPKKIKEKNK